MKSNHIAVLITLAIPTPLACATNISCIINHKNCKFYLLPVLLGELLLLLAALGLLLDGGDDPPGTPPSAHHVLVRHRQQVPLLHQGHS